MAYNNAPNFWKKDSNVNKFAIVDAGAAQQSSPTNDPFDIYHSFYYGTPLTLRFPIGPVLPPGPTFSASGGTVTTIGGTRLHTFTTSGSFVITNPSAAKTITMFVVGGGGGSGGWVGGGGGGGRIMLVDYNMPSATYAVTVGAGGTRGQFDFPAALGIIAGDGGASEVAGVVSAPGGGGSGQYSTNAGRNGGSGGGGSQVSPWNAKGNNTLGISSAGLLISNFGSDGGVGPDNGNSPGGGGGGAVAIGGSITTPPSSCNGGPGGNGLLYALTGLYYGGGGGGSNGNPTIWGGSNTTPPGGLGGGGSGALFSASANIPGVNGTANTGGGAGGGWAGDGSSTAFGAAGGSGIVIISYPFPYATSAPHKNPPIRIY